MRNNTTLRKIADAHALVRDVTESGVVVSAFGELDFLVSPELERSLREGATHGLPLVVDMSECRFIDASVITVLVRMHGLLGDRFNIVAPPGCNTRRVLDLVELSERLSMYSSVRAALGGLGPRSVRENRLIPQLSQLVIEQAR